MSAARRAIALMAVIVTLTAAFAAVGTMGFDDSEGSVTQGDLNRIDTFDSSVKTINYNGTPAVQVWVDAVFSQGDLVDYVSYAVCWKALTSDLDGYHIALTTTTVEDGETSSGYMNFTNPDLAAGDTGDFNRGSTSTDTMAQRTLTVAVNNQSGGGPFTPLNGTNAVSFKLDISRQTGYICETTVTYNANGGSGSGPSAFSDDKTLSHSPTFSDRVSVQLASSGFTMADYTLVGWNTQANGQGTSYDLGETADFTVGDDIVLYAQWQIVSYDIALYTDGGTTPWKTVTVQKGQILQVEDPPAPDGKLFAGWYTDNTCTQPYEYPAVTDDDALFAKFVDELEFTTTPTAKANVTPIEPRGTLLFNSMTSASAAKVLWEFPDGTTSTDRVTTHWFEPGTHTVKLTVWNSNGEMSETELDVTVTDGNDNLPILWIPAGILAVAVIGIVIWRVAI